MTGEGSGLLEEAGKAVEKAAGAVGEVVEDAAKGVGKALDGLFGGKKK